MHYDIFNGDADGIFALHQYRLENPKPEARLITGVKRDIRLLKQVEDEENCSLTVFDISLDSNRTALQQLLSNKNKVIYFDHHYAGIVPDSPLLQSFIDPSAETCTSVIVNSAMQTKYTLWAICGAFGDNLHQLAKHLGKTENLTDPQINQLQELGELFNYNGYGVQLKDLHFHPRELYLAVQPYSSPFDFLVNSTQVDVLKTGYREDLELAMQQQELNTMGTNRVYVLPDESWARRVTGVFSNLRARELPGSAHAVLTENKDKTLRVSVRAPLDDRRDADNLCNLFPTGGGRAAAAGINSLPPDQFDLFLEKFHSYYH